MKLPDSPTPEDGSRIEKELTALLLFAKATFAARQIRKTLDTLHAAHSLATAHGLHRHAAQFKRALSILAQGSRPKLLTRGDFQLGDQKER